MSTAEQYRVKANEYAKLAETASRPKEAREFHRLERSFAELADNAQWVADNRTKVLQSATEGHP